MDKWLADSLTKILQFEVPQDLIQYIMSIDNENSLREYLKSLIDFDNSDHQLFFKELTSRKFPVIAGTGKQYQAKQQKKKSKAAVQNESAVSPEKPHEKEETSQQKEHNRKKSKFVNLYSQEGKNAQVVLLKGRHRCECQASKHTLINNCVTCGRIVCKQEGSGPCLYCGSLVCTPEEQKEINAKTKASAKLVEALMEKSRPKGWEAALAHRNRLLEFDRTSERRTQVTDDDSDYFNTNSVWLSAPERDRLTKYEMQQREKKHASRRDKKMTFDFAGRQIIEEAPDNDIDLQAIRELSEYNTVRQSTPAGPRDEDGLVLEFDPSVVHTNNYSTAVKSGISTRVQDAELLEMSDSGKCLSMHQPWASLLVEGIKLHEGRSWYTSHRGRLWIAAAAQPPHGDVIKALENQYRAMYPDKDIKFPTFYPTGCLLGCVHVDDCLPQEEYQKIYGTDAESDSPYVFICSNPISLKLRFPIKGQHKIYNLDKMIHQAAVKSIQKMAKIEAQQANGG